MLTDDQLQEENDALVRAVATFANQKSMSDQTLRMYRQDLEYALKHKRVKQVKALMIHGKAYHTARTAAETWAREVSIRYMMRVRAQGGGRYPDPKNTQRILKTATRRSKKIFKRFFEQ